MADLNPMNNQPEHFDSNSLDIAEDKRLALLRLFPEVRTEGSKINFEVLRASLGDAVDVGRERYGINWPGKAECMRVIQAPSAATLIPCRGKSANFDTADNLIIEGDNLEVLKLLQKSYMGKVKVIYIDPPYNTGNEFIYEDDYKESLKAYLEYTGQTDGEGRKIGTNSDTSGRFHSKWLNMMYPRLYLARNLLADDGVIFISIDDHELSGLRLLMNEVMGEECFKNCIIFRRGVKNVQAQFETVDALNIGHEYIVTYAKNPQTRFKKLDIELEDARSGSWNNHWRGTDRPTMRYEIFGIVPETGQWRWSKERSLQAVANYQTLISELEAVEKDDSQASIDEWYARKLEETGEDLDLLRLSATGKPEHYVPASETKLGSDLWADLSPRGSVELNRLFGKKKVFDNPKPVALIKRLLSFTTDRQAGDLVLDFFAGSGSTAHAVLDMNREDGGDRKFILIQLPELTGRPDFPTIAEITEERVRRVLKKLYVKETAILDLDGPNNCPGFRVFELSESNFKPWNSEVEYDEAVFGEQLHLQIDHVRDHRTKDDLLYEILLKSGFPLATAVKTIDVSGKAIYSVADGALIICLDGELSLELIRAVANMKPERAVFLDDGFAGNDQLKTNAVQIFKSNGVTTFKTV